ncbi:hypothetical protein ADEAN_000297900 [Angomonas deanei]|uniref:Uncharacterized protein n=1 Tax=Angomonas deanei TaxID=59799 RepID=A0A7G2C8S3_9TRYP|nr:hypothetical protein ADEAN_000297900 [Angomonas deanei]
MGNAANGGNLPREAPTTVVITGGGRSTKEGGTTGAKGRVPESNSRASSYPFADLNGYPIDKLGTPPSAKGGTLNLSYDSGSRRCSSQEITDSSSPHLHTNSILVSSRKRSSDGVSVPGSERLPEDIVLYESKVNPLPQRSPHPPAERVRRLSNDNENSGEDSWSDDDLISPFANGDISTNSRLFTDSRRRGIGFNNSATRGVTCSAERVPSAMDSTHRKNSYSAHFEPIGRKGIDIRNNLSSASLCSAVRRDGNRRESFDSSLTRGGVFFSENVVVAEGENTIGEDKLLGGSTHRLSKARRVAQDESDSPSKGSAPRAMRMSPAPPVTVPSAVRPSMMRTSLEFNTNKLSRSDDDCPNDPNGRASTSDVLAVSLNTSLLLPIVGGPQRGKVHTPVSSSRPKSLAQVRRNKANAPL